MNRRGTPLLRPPARLGTWPDRETMLADRGRALDALTSQLLGPARLLLLWGLAACAAAGWAVVVAALTFFSNADDPFSTLTGAVTLALGLAVLVPTGVGIGAHVRRDRSARELLRQWLTSAPDPVPDVRVRARGLLRLWRFSPLGPAAAALGLCVTTLPSLDADAETFTAWTFILGLCAILCLTAALSLLKVHHHRRLVRPR